MATVNREKLIPRIEEYKQQLDLENGDATIRTLYNKREIYIVSGNISHIAQNLIEVVNKPAYNLR